MMKISEAFDLYKNNYIFIKRQSERILENHDYIKRRFIETVGDKSIEKVDLNDIHIWTCSISHKKTKDGRLIPRKNNTIRNDLIGVKMVFKYLKMLGYKVIEPSLIPIPQREDSIRPFLTADEVTRMIDSAYNLRNKFVVSLLYSSGIRLSEMISLNRDSIKNGAFSVIGKGKKMRLCFIDMRTEEIMNEYLKERNDDCEALIISYKNKARMTPTNVQLLIKNTAKRANIDKKVTPHILRHSFATNYIQNDGNIRYLSALMGHASMNTTLTYTHVVDNDLRKQYQRYHTF